MQGIQIFRNMVKCCYSYRSPQSFTCCMTAQVPDDDNDDYVDENNDDDEDDDDNK